VRESRGSKGGRVWKVGDEGNRDGGCFVIAGRVSSSFTANSSHELAWRHQQIQHRHRHTSTIASNPYTTCCHHIVLCHSAFHQHLKSCPASDATLFQLLILYWALRTTYRHLHHEALSFRTPHPHQPSLAHSQHGRHPELRLSCKPGGFPRVYPSQFGLAELTLNR